MKREHIQFGNFKQCEPHFSIFPLTFIYLSEKHPIYDHDVQKVLKIQFLSIRLVKVRTDRFLANKTQIRAYLSLN